jgi:hypothetical protein
VDARSSKFAYDNIAGAAMLCQVALYELDGYDVLQNAETNMYVMRMNTG